MCMGGGGGGAPLTPAEMSDEMLAQKASGLWNNSPMAKQLQAKRDQQFNNRVAALKEAYNNPKVNPLTPISPFARVVASEVEMVKKDPTKPVSFMQRVAKYAPGSDEYFNEIAARELRYKDNPVARAKAAAPYQAEIDRRAGIQEAFNQQKADREKVLADNNQAMLDAQAKQQELIKEQERTAAALRAKQEQEMAAIRAAGSAATQSMQILATQPTTKAPTASMSAGKDRSTLGRRRGSASLRIGNTGQAKGAGPNIAV